MSRDITTPGAAHGQERTLVDVLDEAFDRPGGPALVANGCEFAFGDLDSLTRHLAERLLLDGAGPGVRVGVAMDRSAGAIVAILAALRTGASYVPLDPSLPADRLAFMASDAAIGLLVAGRDEDVSWLPEPVPVVRIDRHPRVAATSRDAAGARRGFLEDRAPTSAADEAYVIYTSGSTGRPKGCSVSHGNVVALLEAALPLFEVTADDRWLLFHSSSFDFSVWELWGALATGAAGVVADSAVVKDPVAVVELCRASGVSVLCAVPSVFSGLARHLHRCSALRYVIFGGEALRATDVRTASGTWNGGAGPRFVNMYGITETTVHVTFKELDVHDLDLAGPHTSIGAELPHLRIAVLDEDGRPVPDGQDGELWIAGTGVARGYVGRDELTADRFRQVDGVRMYRSGDVGRRLPDGELAYRGRLDDQVKLRGFRIELGEVESTLRAHPGVHGACAVLVGAPPAPVTLEVAVVADAGVAAADLREFAATRLPTHMVPARVVAVDELPQLGSGKVDRSAVVAQLQRAGAPGGEEVYTASGAAGEQAALPSLDGLDKLDARSRHDLVSEFLMAAWATVLGHQDFGPDDGFFDVGGDSLSVVTVHELLATRVLDVGEVRVVDLFLYPSVRALADHVAGLVPSNP